MYIFVGELHLKKKKNIKHEPLNDVETLEHGEEHSKKKKKTKSEPADSEGMTCGKYS